MQDLIPIHPGKIADDVTPTVNARDLHTFLNVATRFNDWVTTRIEQYGFIENQDFVTFTENPVKGRPSIEYAVTLDMAKELAMVERNDQGKLARQYFIACEKRLKTLPDQPTPDLIQQAKEFKALFSIARLIGLDRNVSAVSANNAVYQRTGTNMLQLLGQAHLDNPDQVLFYTPTELGKQLAVSARTFNLLLAEAGMQSKVGERWVPSDAAEGFFRVLDTGKKHGDGTLVQQVKWSDRVLPLLARNEAA